MIVNIHGSYIDQLHKNKMAANGCYLYLVHM